MKHRRETILPPSAPAPAVKGRVAAPNALGESTRTFYLQNSVLQSDKRLDLD